jgi:enoyl-CoA hydratase/carnithine racemase
VRVESHRASIADPGGSNVAGVEIAQAGVTEFETLFVDRGVGEDAGIVTVTLNRPKVKNAISQQMWRDLLVVLTTVSTTQTDRVMVLTGANNEFCSGADLSGSDRAERNHYYAMRDVTTVAMALQRVPQPVIAKVPGVAVGAGANLAFGCDLIVASDHARFSEIFARRGLSIDCGGSWLLPRLVGMHKAKELALFADILSAAEAAEFGLVNRVVPAAELDGFVTGWARRLAAGPPLALAPRD